MFVVKRRFVLQTFHPDFMFGVLFFFRSIICFMYDCMDACVLLYELRPIGEIYVVIKKKKNVED